MLARQRWSSIKKKNTNLIFIDERTGKTPATYEGHKAGKMRWERLVEWIQVTTAFGDVVITKTSNTRRNVYHSCSPISVVDGRTVRIQGNWAVGYKVYDETGKLVMVANTNDFLIPNNPTLDKLSVNVVGGNGKEVEVIKNGAVKEEYKKPFTFDNSCRSHLCQKVKLLLSVDTTFATTIQQTVLYYLTKDRSHRSNRTSWSILVAASRFWWI